MGDEQFDLIPAADATQLVVADPITEKHQEIGEEFLYRVRNMITHLPGKIGDYSVKRAKQNWDTHDETITLEYSNGRRLIVKVETKADAEMK